MVYIKYNQALKERFDSRDVIDPIVLDDIDDSNEWLVGEMGRPREDAEDELVFDDDHLTWGDVANVTGVAEPITYTRRQTRLMTTPVPTFGTSTSTARGKGKEVIVEDDEETESDQEIEDEEEEEIYSISSSEGQGSDEGEEMEDLEEDD